MLCKKVMFLSLRKSANYYVKCTFPELKDFPYGTTSRVISRNYFHQPETKT